MTDMDTADDGRISASKTARRVLVVEDEASVLDFVVQGLEHHGYDVTAAASGQKAIEIVTENPDAIDLVVSDVVMPFMTGPEMMRALRDVRPGLGLLLLSGYDEESCHAQMKDDEEYHFLAKPFSLAQLATEVDRTFPG